MIRFCPLFSSSSGNSVYIGENNEGILVDVGRTAKQIREKLESIGVEEKAIKAVFLTHEHADHINGLSVFLKRNKIPVYASSGTILALKNKGVLTDCHIDFTVTDDGVEIGDMFIKPFKTSHDCADGRGYTITGSDGSTRVAVATDTGIVTPEIVNSITGCKLVYIESNHDVNMLKNGPYYYDLKKRILSDKGHLSNDACASVLKTLVNNGTTQFILAHLSPENNTPHLAYETSINALLNMGALVNRDYQLKVAEAENNSKVVLV